MTSYASWDQLPEQFKFIAVDGDGEAYAYMYKPSMESAHENWQTSGDDDTMFIGDFVLGSDEPWWDSLIERPSKDRTKILYIVRENSDFNSGNGHMFINSVWEDPKLAVQYVESQQGIMGSRQRIEYGKYWTYATGNGYDIVEHHISTNPETCDADIKKFKDDRKKAYEEMVARQTEKDLSDALEAQKKVIREAALAKLTQAEREALGLA